VSRSITATLAAAVALGLGACGSSGDSASTSVTPETAKARVERAAQLELAAEPIPAEAREQGLRASYSTPPPR
jgi:uncharacterized lipoprotein YmbA